MLPLPCRDRHNFTTSKPKTTKMNNDASNDEQEASSGSSLELSDYEESSMEDDDLEPIQQEERRFLFQPRFGQTYGSSDSEIQHWQQATHHLLEDSTVDFAIAYDLTDKLMTAANELLRRIGPARGHQLLELARSDNTYYEPFLLEGEYSGLSWIVWNPFDEIFEVNVTTLEFGNCPQCLSAMPLGMNCPYCPDKCSARLYFMGKRGWKDCYDNPPNGRTINRTLEEYLYLSQAVTRTYSPHKIAALVNREQYSIVKLDRGFFNARAHDPRRNGDRSPLPTTIPLPEDDEEPMPPGLHPWHAMSIEQLIKKIAAHLVKEELGLINLPIDIEEKLRDCTGASFLEIRKGIQACENCFTPRANLIIKANQYNLFEDQSFRRTESEQFTWINTDPVGLLQFL